MKLIFCLKSPDSQPISLGFGEMQMAWAHMGWGWLKEVLKGVNYKMTIKV